jgi:hypothetical protein
MQAFTESLGDKQLRGKLQDILDGKGAFRKFKDQLEPFPKVRKQWYGFNAQENRKKIEAWLKTLGIEYYQNRIQGSKGTGD